MKMICKQETCRDARLVRPLKNVVCIRFNNHAICFQNLLRGRTNLCILIYIPNGADARPVRPYMLGMAILIRKIVEMASCASACRDARLVRPLKTLGTFASTIMLSACYSPCADARADVYRLTFTMERTHEPCVPTCLLWAYCNVQGQSSYMFFLGILMS